MKLKSKFLTKMLIAAGAATAVFSCGGEKDPNFKYVIDEFADIKVIRFQIPGWDELSLQQKAYAYHLSEAAKWGRDITWDQFCKYNLQIRKTIENIIDNYSGDRTTKDYQDFLVYAKRVFFSNGIHHHYSEDKFFPECSKEYFASLIEDVKDNEVKVEGEKILSADELLKVIYDKDIYAQRRSTSSDGDIVALSSVNFYGDGVTRQEVDKFYDAKVDPKDEYPVAYGLNTKVVKEDGKLVELPWKVGGIYGPTIEKIVEELSKAREVAENESQKKALGLLIEYYRTGDLKIWDKFNVEWVQDTLGTVDYINGFIEDYDDPLGRKATWEGYVHIKDFKASERSEVLSENAQWFENNSPVDPRFKKESVKGVSAKVVNGACLAGACYPSTPIGINLPNSDWIRKDYGSKSVTIANITHSYDFAAQESPKSVLNEFAYDEDEIALYKKYGSYVDEIHTDLHECLGHGSGQLLPGVSSTALQEYQSTLEEARADLFGLYFVADPKMVELGIIPDEEAYKAGYQGYIRNGLMSQFSRVELGKKNTEAHMQNRQLIASWCYEKGAKDNVIEKKIKNGKTYYVVNDYPALRGLFAELLAEIQRIKSEGDYEAGKNLVETYAVNIDPVLHKEVLERYAALNLKPYGGFVNPDIVPVVEDGKIVDYKLVYPDDYVGQMMEYGKEYSVYKGYKKC